MSRLSKALLGVSVTCLVVLLALFFFLRHLVTKSYPKTDGTVVVGTGVHSNVDVYRDEYGVPHLRANDEDDLMFTAGYVHAQDRLWQMDMLRRAGQGRLSEILGPSTLDLDKLFRTIGLSRIAQEIAGQLHPESRRMLENYASGVNSFITSHRGAYPAEFDLLNYEPEPWTPEQSLLIVRLMAWELNLSWWTDLTYGEIATKVSPGKLLEIIPGYPDSVEATVSAFNSGKRSPGVRSFLDATRRYRELFGLGSPEGGSNAWVVDSSKSLSGKPILANDPHLPIPAPSRWYEIHLSAPGLNVAGVSLVGTPVIVIGHNDSIAWGLTNAMIDEADFYIEQVDSLDGHTYAYQGKLEVFEEHEEKILVKDADSVVITVRSSRHGPIISDVHPTNKHQDSLRPEQAVAIRWTGFDVSDELFGFYLMNRAENAKQFEDGLRQIAVPCQSVVYADVAGNIAYWTAGRIPLRGKQSALFPLPGWTSETEWKGFIPFEELPAMMNPASGIIACANQKIADKSYPHYLSMHWEPPSRIQRIRHLLASAEKFSGEDFKQFQQDVVSIHASEVVPNILSAFSGETISDPYLSEALTYLRNWDDRYTRGDVATSIFNSFFLHVVHNIYADEMGEELYGDFVFSGRIPYRVTSQLLAADSSLWWDDVRTLQQESKQEILRASLVDAVNELKISLGNEMKNWRWGELHTVTFQHPFGTRKPLDKVFNIGPFPIGGGGTTLNKTEFRFTAPYAATVGASMRQVIDLAHPHDASMVITSGQSGQALHQHYDDQTPLWLNGGYHQVTTDWNVIRNSGWDHLVLQPEKK